MPPAIQLYQLKVLYAGPMKCVVDRCCHCTLSFVTVIFVIFIQCIRTWSDLWYYHILYLVADDVQTNAQTHVPGAECMTAGLVCAMLGAKVMFAWWPSCVLLRDTVRIPPRWWGGWVGR